ncbi:hypothetical protein HanHA300_Chr14g0525521 [Helianthus annuus]|nr:hypothetical protein HanHA300_Chr14g0525521 [Helianthus annuus]KAJ0660047.1 hypothetical protein HanOQP8_Chr14g0533251 [Helianthus annuus]
MILFRMKNNEYVIMTLKLPVHPTGVELVFLVTGGKKLLWRDRTAFKSSSCLSNTVKTTLRFSGD